MRQASSRLAVLATGSAAAAAALTARQREMAEPSAGRTRPWNWGTSETALCDGEAPVHPMKKLKEKLKNKYIPLSVLGIGTYGSKCKIWMHC